MPKNELNLGEIKLQYAKPRLVSRIEDCHFYHTMDVPGVGKITGDWDLRHNTGAIFGGENFAGKRVLEIGPASGYLTFWMESNGAEVLSVEVPDEPGWDFVPYPESILSPIYDERREVMRKLKNSYWFCHNAMQSKAKLIYDDVYNLPNDIGQFDVAVLANVLLHTQNPVRILEQCANYSKSLIVCDMLYPELEGSPVCRLAPDKVNKHWDTWWNFSSDFFSQYFGVLGYDDVQVSFSEYEHMGVRKYPFFTVTATR